MCRVHGGLLNRKAGFDSRVGDREIIESSGCAGFAHDPAKVEDQVQFLAGTSHDAGARRQGDRLQPGSSGFDSHRRLLQAEEWAGEVYVYGNQDETDRALGTGRNEYGLLHIWWD